MVRRSVGMLRLVAFWLMCTVATPVLAEQSCTRDRVDLRGDWGQAAFAVEIADTEQSRAQGLMFRESLARGAGMLFVYDRPGRAAFWMKNTLIPLDILFLDETGRVTSVHSNAMPHDETPIPGGDRVFAVLEINAGLAQRYGIEPGSEMRHEVFSNNMPVWPC